jgi:Tfp pilus assembly pilus retraction ATPase PilT
MKPDFTGFTHRQLAVLAALCLQKNGLILICGPEKSGNTAAALSLYSRIRSSRTAETPDILFMEECSSREHIQNALQEAFCGSLVLAVCAEPGAAEAVLRIQKTCADIPVFAAVLRAVIVQEFVYDNGETDLITDIALANSTLADVVTRYDSAEEIDRGFCHYTNVMQHILKNLRKLQMSRETDPAFRG